MGWSFSLPSCRPVPTSGSLQWGCGCAVEQSHALASFGRKQPCPGLSLLEVCARGLCVCARGQVYKRAREEKPALSSGEGPGNVVNMRAIPEECWRSRG